MWVNWFVRQTLTCYSHHPSRDGGSALLHHRKGEGVTEVRWVKVYCRLSQHLQASSRWTHKARLQWHRTSQRLLPPDQQAQVFVAEQKLVTHVAAALPRQLSGNCWQATHKAPPQRDNVLPAKTRPWVLQQKCNIQPGQLKIHLMLQRLISSSTWETNSTKTLQRLSVSNPVVKLQEEMKVRLWIKFRKVLWTHLKARNEELAEHSYTLWLHRNITVRKPQQWLSSIIQETITTRFAFTHKLHATETGDGWQKKPAGGVYFYLYLTSVGSPLATEGTEHQLCTAMKDREGNAQLDV